MSAGSPFLAASILNAPESEMEEASPDSSSLLRQLANLNMEDLPVVAPAVVRHILAASSPCPEQVVFDAIGEPLDSALCEHLVRRRILRRLDDNEESALLPYHGRMQDALSGDPHWALSEQQKLQFAEAWEAYGASNDVLANQYHRAGDHRRASEHAVRVAEQAEKALSFSGAADWYERAIRWSKETPELCTRKAHALYNAGRCTEAGPAFMRAAALNPERSLDLQVRGIDSYLIAGRVPEGIAAAGPALEELGVKLPATPGKATFGLLGGVGRLLMRGSQIRSKYSGEELERARLKTDLSWALSRGLLYVRPMEGSAMAFQSLLEALDTGDAVRSGRVLAFAGAGMFTQIGPLEDKGLSYLEQVKTLADETGDAYLAGMYEAWSAFHQMYIPNWGAAAEGAQRAIAIFDRECVGASWELMVAAGIATLSLVHMGELGQAVRVAEHSRERARETGDLYGQVLMQQMTALSSILMGKTDTGRERLDWIEREWTDEYTVVHFYVAVYRALADLTDGDPAAAKARFLDTKEAFIAAGGYRVPLSRVDAHSLEGRIFEACLRQGISTEGLSPSQTLAQKLEKESRGDGLAYALLLRASAEARSEDREAAVRSLNRASSRFRGLGMHLHGQAAKFAAAQLADDESGLASSHSELAKRGLRSPGDQLGWLIPSWAN